MPRQSEGTTEDVRVRATPDEAQMARDIAAHLGTSQNKAARWALRYAWQHATSTTDHKACPPNSPCASATRGLTPGAKRPPAAAPDQMTITHSATVEEQ
jgi:hypothetical protein